MGFFGKSRGYDTKLSPAEEAAYQAWAQAVGRAGDTQDYDLRGAWKANAQQAGNGHLPDTWKKPNHPTFSQESQYSSPDQTGGQWVQGQNGKWGFWASPWNMNTQGTEGLLNYFKQREPDSSLLLPINYSLPRRNARPN